MASLWEILDPTQLRWTGSAIGGDQGRGPVSDRSGWVHTGRDVSNLNVVPGRANCLGWTTNAPDQYGTAVALTDRWTRSDVSYLNTTPIDPWFALAKSCDEVRAVWCVEDDD